MLDFKYRAKGFVRVECDICIAEKAGDSYSMRFIFSVPYDVASKAPVLGGLVTLGVVFNTQHRAGNALGTHLGGDRRSARCSVLKTIPKVEPFYTLPAESVFTLPILQVGFGV